MNPTTLLSMHLLTDSLVEKMCMEDLTEQQASKFRVGWKTIEVISTLEVPLRSTCSVCPLSALNTFSFVPFIDAVAIKVPSGLTVM